MAARNDWPGPVWARFEAAVLRELPRWGGSRRRRAIIEAVFVALVDPTGVMTQRRGALERARWVLADWRSATTRLAEVETRMVEVLDELGLTEYVTSIPGGQRGGSGGDARRDRRPRPLRQSPRPGQTRRAMPARQCQRHLSRVGRGFPGAADPGCGWPPGARYGGHWRTIR